MRQTLRIVAWMLLILAGYATRLSAQYTGVASTSTPGLNVRHPLTTDQSILFPPQRDLILLSGDTITVSVFGVLPVYSDIERISLDGSVRLPLAGVIYIAGLSIKDAEEAIARFMEEKEVFHDAQVSILVTDMPNHIATVVGAIQHPVPIVGQRRLLDVLAAAGGLPPTASTVIQIDREGVPEPIYVDLGNDPSHSVAANIPIFSGDVITTGTVGPFYVVGAVTIPGEHPLQGSRPTTVMQALALSGGTSPAAKREEAQLVRTVGNTRTVIPLHLKAIQNGQEVDPVLQAEDIILVPGSALKAFFRITNFTGVVSVAVALAALLR